MELITTISVTAGAIYLILTGYKPQIVLMVGGIVMTSIAMVNNPTLNLVADGYLSAKYATNSRFVDTFAMIGQLFSSRMADFGINVMAIAGFAKYMDSIGASACLASIAIKPLKHVHSPYLILSFAYVMGQALAIIIPSASGLGLLLMVTLYPILIKTGVSSISATAVIGTTSAVGMGPSSSYSLIASQNANIDVMAYFLHYQLPVGIPVIISAAIAHYFTQKYFDKKHKDVLTYSNNISSNKTYEKPFFFAVLPFLPLFLLLLFGNLSKTEAKINIITAVIISVIIAMLVQILWSRDPKQSSNELKTFFDGMGGSFADVITLIVAGEVFANGLKMMGFVNTVIRMASELNTHFDVFIISMTTVTSLFAVILGSGHASFIAFSSLIPDISSKLGISAPAMILPMQYASGIMRSVSPISGAIVAVSGVSGIPTIDVVKRTAIPMIVALIVNTVLSLVLF